MRKMIICGLLALIGAAGAAESTTAVPVYSNSVSKLMWYQAELKSFPPQGVPTRNGPWGTQNWTTVDQFAAWDIQVEKAGEYEVAVNYQCGQNAGGSAFEISTLKSKVTGATHETGNAWKKPNWELQPLAGTLKLPAGKSRIEMHIARKAPDAGQILQLRALELVRPSVRKAMAERARKSRADTSWMVEAKYGIMTHWTARSMPRTGPQKPYCDAVRDFDVERYADMAREAGAGYVVFTTSHGGLFFPAPIQSIEKLLPGRTCPRDLLADLEPALKKRGIRMIVYSGWSTSDDEFAKAFGYRDPARLQEYANNMMAVMREIGQRYGTKMSGLFFDGGFETYLYPYQFPFEQFEAAARTGNRQRVISFNQWIFPKITDFQDYWIGESGGDLLPAPDPSTFAPGGVQAGIQGHLNPYLDDPWVHNRPDVAIHAPLHTEQELVEYVRHCVALKVVPSINLGIYQDGTVSEETLNQMRAVRKAIRGQ
jgi:hypothetical protein